MQKFTVKIDLSAFFDDERKLVVIMVDPNWENVECLQRRVESVFDVESVCFLSHEGCFIPPQEPIEMIRFFELLKAFVPRESQKKRQRKMKKSKNSEMSAEGELSNDLAESGKGVIASEQPRSPTPSFNLDAAQKKRKYQSLESGFASSTPNQAKRSKNCVRVNDNEIVNKSNEITSTSEQRVLMGPPFSRIQKTRKKSQRFATTLDLEENSFAGKVVNESISLANGSRDKYLNGSEKLEESRSVDPQKQWSGNRKRSTSSSDNRETVTTTDETGTSPPFSKHSSTSSRGDKQSSQAQGSRSRHVTKPDVDCYAVPCQKGHIFFNEHGEALTTSSQVHSTEKSEVVTKVMFRCQLDEASESRTPRRFELKPRMVTDVSKERSPIEIREHIVLPPNEEKRASGTCEINKLPDTDGEMNDDADRRTLETTEEEQTQASQRTIQEVTTAHIRSSNEIEADHVQKASNELNADSSSHTQQANNESSDLKQESVDFSVDNKTEESSCREIEVSSDEIEEVSEIIDLSETDDVNTTSQKMDISERSLRHKDLTVAKMLKFAVELHELPNIGDIVIFKMSRLNKKQSPTDFLVGKCEYINKRSKSIKLLIIDGQSEISEIPTKFHCNLDDSSCEDRSLQLKISDMLEPKVFKMS